MPDDLLQDLGRGIARLHLKLSRIQELLEAAPAAAPAASSGAELEALFDLIEAIESALARRQSERSERRWFRRPSKTGDDLWRGLAIAVAEARERLQRAGIEPTPVDGPFDPTLHRAIEVVPASAERAEGTLAATHRRGWLRRQGRERVVLREAHVSVHGSTG
jgi:molecular chaperone GrpE (heat shock protein)